MSEPSQDHRVKALLKETFGRMVAGERWLFWHRNREIWVVLERKPYIEVFRNPHEPANIVLYEGIDFEIALEYLDPNRHKGKHHDPQTQ